jgi:hypothetical protein
MRALDSKESSSIPEAGAGGGLAHGDAGLVGAHLAGELVHGPEQGLPGQGGGGACGGGSHGSCGSSTEDQIRGRRRVAVGWAGEVVQRARL